MAARESASGAMVSLLLTVKDESANIAALLDSVTLQTRRPNELVVVDGGSRDGTLAALQAFDAEQSAREDGLSVAVLHTPGANISQGRNAAFACARGEILAITDAGVRLPADWLAEITAPLLEDETLDVVSGFFHAAPKSAFEAALGAATLPLLHEIDADRFLPSSRSIALRRSAFVAVGGYPDWLDYCEDLILDLRLRASGARFRFVPTASVAYRPRESLAAFGRQYFRYARGDGKADLWRRRHAIRYVTYLLITPVLFALGIAEHVGFWALLALGMAVYLGPLYRRLPALLRRLPALTLPGKLRAWLWVGPLRVYGDVAKMLGYPFGWYWRWRARPPSWR